MMTEYLYPVDKYNTNTLIETFSSQWAEHYTDHPTDWEFSGYDLLPRHQLLLRYVSEREMTEEEAGEEGHILRHYYVARYDMLKDCFTDDCWFCYADGEVCYNFMKDGGLYSVINCGTAGPFMVRKESGKERFRTRNLGDYVVGFQCDRKGRMHVGYACSLDEDVLYRVFESGKRTKEYHLERGGYGDAIYLDGSDNVYYYVAGWKQIYGKDSAGKLIPQTMTVDCEDSIDGFGMSRNQERMVAVSLRDGENSLIYRFTNHGGVYDEPVRCAIHGAEPEAGIQGAAFCDSYGIIENGSKLLVIDLNYCTEEDRKKYDELEKAVRGK